MNKNKFYTKLLNFSLYVFVFAVTFESWNPFDLPSSFNLAKLSGIFYIFLCVPLVKYFRIGKNAYFFLPLLGYVFIEIFSTTLNNENLVSILQVMNIKLIQMVLICLLIVNHISFNKELVPGIINSYILSVGVISILNIFEIGTEFERARLTLFGENPNMIGMKASFAFVIIFSKLSENKMNSKILKLGLFLLLVPIIQLIIDTASRGALVTILIGPLMIMYLRRSNILNKVIWIFIIGTILLGFLDYILSTNEVLQYRVDQFVEEGETGRNDIWIGAIDIFMNNPLIGVGRGNILTEMKNTIGRGMDPHNVFLYVLLTSGIIGFYFFLLFIYRIGKVLYFQLRLSSDVLFVTLFLILIFNMAKAGGFINKTFLWLFLSILIGVTNIESKKYTIENSHSLK